MILSKLEVHGFKSFGRKTEVKFDGGITAVVGPNGCGKTNIVDAIRWGLGEQRPTVLRADRMENIIFGGSQSARPLGMAEVSITFDNSKSILPIDYKEVVVTRRLYRSGESEYLLNKTPVRLKDITDLLMDTGIGADAYSVIELKMIEDILSEKAEDRRRLLEEAAGVTKYKYRLKAALRKLDATQNDLLRVTDIIQEVDRNVKSLKRQVQKAQRYQEIQKELKLTDLRRSRQIYQGLLDKIQPIKIEIRTLQKQKVGKTTEITKDEADLEAMRLNLISKEKDLLAVQEKFSQIVEKIHRHEGDIRVGKERRLSLTNRIERYTQEVEDLRRRLEEQKNHLQVTHQEREAFQVKITSTGRIFTNKKKELEVFQQGLNLQRLELTKQKREIIGCFEEIQRLHEEEAKFRTQVDNNRGRLDRLEEEDNSFEEALHRLEKQREELDTILKQAYKSHGASKENLEKSLREKESVAKQLENEKEQFYRNQGERDVLQGRHRFLNQIIENQEGITDGSRIILNENLNGLVGVLADLLHVDKKLQYAVETGLGEAAQYLVMTDIDKAMHALTVLDERGGGRVSIIALDRLKGFQKTQPSVTLPKTDDMIGWADDLISCDAAIKPAVTFLLGDMLIVRDMDTARKLLKEDLGACRLVTLKGEMISGRGLVQASFKDAKDIGLIGRKERIKELADQISALEVSIANSQEQMKAKEIRLRDISDQIQTIEQEVKQSGDRVHELEKDQTRIQFEMDKSEEGQKRNSGERQRLLDEIEQGKTGIEAIRPKLEAVTEKRDMIEKRTVIIQTEVDRLEQDERTLEEEVHKHNLMVVRLNGEAKNLDYDIERSTKLIEELQKTAETRAKEIEEAKIAIEEQTLEIQLNEEKLMEEFEEREVLDRTRQARETDFRELQEVLQGKEKEIRVVRRDREEAAERIHTLEMEISELEHQMSALSSRIQESYEEDIAALSFDEVVEINQAEREIEDLKFKLKNLGPVNLVAIEEYEQENERFNFLMQQRDDLLSAEETLKETIKKINETARERFLEIFDQVRKNFQNLYVRFFKGGEADLRLEEGVDPLEAKVEIMARPAGKQLRAIDLLSGGEKALTAISLLFALYEVKPSPFCILDEVDAPLDDANIERFTHVLSQYAEKTQFVIVSHNKNTMKAADALYGVTMEEEGVSKLVSVRFNEKAEKTASN